jgi:glycosyltransferase involved in cell wall biosynthesis
MMTTSKVLLVVPAWNEADSLPSLLTQLKDHCPLYDVLVVNDGSFDDTTGIAKAYGTVVVELPCNLGIGGAVQTGFLYAQRYGYDTVVRLDADGQHPPEEVEDLLARLNVGDVDVVIGSRFLVQGPGFRSSRLRRIGINWLNFLLRSLTRQKITDCTSGFWAYGHEAVAFFATNYPQDYPEPEGIILLTRNGFRIAEVPVHMRERQKGASSISGLKPVYYMTKVTLAVLIAFLRQPIRSRARF